MNAIAQKAKLADPAKADFPGLPFNIPMLMDAILKQQKALNDAEEMKGTNYARQLERVRALQDLVLGLRADVAEETIMQLILVSARFLDDAMEGATVDEIRDAIDARTDQLQTIIFRLLCIKGLDPAKAGADTYINIAAMEPEGYVPPWAHAAREARR